VTLPDPTDPVRVDAPTLQDRLKRDASVIYLRSRWLGSRVPTSVQDMREAAERLDTLEAQLADERAEVDRLSLDLATKVGLLHIARGQVTQAVNIVRDWQRGWIGSPSFAPERLCELILDAFAAAGLPVGGETLEESETDQTKETKA
jgi:hypothetical protein